MSIAGHVGPRPGPVGEALGKRGPGEFASEAAGPATLGGPRVLDATRALAQQSGIPGDALTLVDRSTTYAHNDPSAASPENEFLEHLVPFLAEVTEHGHSD